MIRNIKFLTKILILCLLCVFCALGFAACEEQGSDHTHIYDNGVVIKQATCTEQGEQSFTCSICGESYTTSIPMTNHNPSSAVEENRVEPTCTTAGGYDAVIYCSLCNTELSRERKVIDALGHDYTEEVKEPTCTEQGYTTYTCTRCDYSHVDDYVEKSAHDYEWTTTKEPTETEEGTKTGICKVCGYTITKAIPELNHKHNYTATVIEPTCTMGGYTLHVCTCEDTYTDNETPALGHNYKEEITAPTCTEQGFTTYTCTRCENSFVDDYIDALGHVPSSAVEENRVEPTTTTEGSYDSVVYCSVCGEEISREMVKIERLGFTVILQNKTRADFTAWADGTEGEKTVIVEKGQTLVIPKMVYDNMSSTARNNSDYNFEGWYYKDKTGKETKLDLSVSFTLQNLNVDTYVITVYAKVFRQWTEFHGSYRG